MSSIGGEGAPYGQKKTVSASLNTADVQLITCNFKDKMLAILIIIQTRNAQQRKKQL